MEPFDLSNLPTLLTNFGDTVGTYLTQRWTGYQILIIAGCFLVAWFISLKVEPRLEARAREIKGKPGLLRIIVAFMRRTEWVFFLVLLGAVREFLLHTTWPSRTYLLSLALTLAASWLAISVLTRIIRNKTFARLIALAIFAYIALGILGWRDDATTILDSLAVNIGGFRLSILFLLRTIAVTAIFLWLASFIGGFLETRIQAMDDLSPSFRVLAGKIVKISLITIASIMALSSTGIDLTALTVFSGAIGVGLGFGLQKVVSNFISGVIILVDRSIKPGDTIALGDTFGWIRELRARFVSVITRDGREYLIPNEDFITQQVVNWSFSDKLVRLDVEFGVAYDSDPHQVSKLAVEAAGTVARVLDAPSAVCWLTGFGTSSLDFKLRFWISDPQGGLTNVRGQVLLALWDSFKRNGVSIPYPHREIIMRTPVEMVHRDAPDAETPAPKKPGPKKSGTA